MANHGQSPQDTSAPQRGGGGQAIVEMCEVTDTSLTFWSRHRFQIGAELQMRLSTAELPSALAAPAGKEPWVMLRGFVVQCQHVRRDDGVQGFRVVLLFDSALAQPPKPKCSRIFMRKPLPCCCSFGLN
jgi:hypothetical protein